MSSSSDPVVRGVLKLTGLDRALVVSLTTRNEFIGVLVVGPTTRPEGWTEVTRERLAGIASLASTALGGLTLLDEVRYQAFHDSTTNLPNTRLFEDRISQAITSGRRTGTRHGFLFIDLDRFKMINDSHGHKMGDDVIRAVATRLTDCVRDADTVARVGGDEFAVLISDLREEEDAATIARKIVDALERPFAVRGMTLAIGASVGITIFPVGMDTYDTVLSRADSAMYEAKSRGGGSTISLRGADQEHLSIARHASKRCAEVRRPSRLSGDGRTTLHQLHEDDRRRLPRVPGDRRRPDRPGDTGHG